MEATVEALFLLRPDMASVFNEWLRQWQADPAGFTKTEDEAPVVIGEPHTYGDSCARTFIRILNEVFPDEEESDV